MGRKQKTPHEGSTADPCFYQTVEFHEMLPADLRFAPEIRIEVRPPLVGASLAEANPVIGALRATAVEYSVRMVLRRKGCCGYGLRRRGQGPWGHAGLYGLQWDPDRTS